MHKQAGVCSLMNTYLFTMFAYSASSLSTFSPTMRLRIHVTHSLQRYIMITAAQISMMYSRYFMWNAANIWGGFVHQIIVRLCNQLLRAVRKLRQTVVKLCNQLLRVMAPNYCETLQSINPMVCKLHQILWDSAINCCVPCFAGCTKLLWDSEITAPNCCETLQSITAPVRNLPCNGKESWFCVASCNHFERNHFG